MKIYNANRSSFIQSSLMSTNYYQDSQNHFGMLAYTDADSFTGYTSRSGLNGDGSYESLMRYSWASGHGGNRALFDLYDDWTGEQGPGNMAVVGGTGSDREYDASLYICS